MKTFHRQAQAREANKDLTGPISIVASKFFAHKIHVSELGVAYHEASVYAGDMLDCWSKLCASPLFEQYIRTKGLDLFKLKEEMRGDERRSFFGMSAHQFFAEANGESSIIQERFEAAREELAQSGIKEQLAEGMEFKKKRKRMFSEHDGDWDMDKKWDATPFTSTKFFKKEFPIIELIFPMVNSGGVSPASISRFGARCFALAEILEQSGYRVAITGEHWCETTMAQPSELNELLKELGEKNLVRKVGGNVERVIVRSASDYGDIQSTAIFGSAEFYRRCFFSIGNEPTHYNHGLPDSAKERSVKGGYGYPINERPLALEPGQVFLDMRAMDQIFSTNHQ